MSEETPTAIETALAKETFSVLEFAQHQQELLPDDTVTLYTDAKTAYELKKLADKQKAYDKKAKKAADTLSIATEDHWVDTDEVDELKAQLEASKLVFTVRGLAPAAVTAIDKHAKATFPYTEGAENPEYNEYFNQTVIADTIVNVRNAVGAIDESKWDLQKVSQFSKIVPPTEFAKLFEKSFNVTFTQQAFEAAVTTDF